jgi:hypothetical protein
VIPARTSGVTYNHRLKLTLHTLDGDFLSCANLGIEGGSFLVSFVVGIHKYIIYIEKIIQN